jgi:hypothetical protein
MDLPGVEALQNPGHIFWSFFDTVGEAPTVDFIKIKEKGCTELELEGSLEQTFTSPVKGVKLNKEKMAS